MFHHNGEPPNPKQPLPVIEGTLERINEEDKAEEARDPHASYKAMQKGSHSFGILESFGMAEEVILDFLNPDRKKIAVPSEMMPAYLALRKC